MNASEQSATVQVPSVSQEAELIQAGKVALTFLERSGQAHRNQAVEVYCHMASVAVKQGHKLPYVEYETPSLKEIISPQAQKGASAWMSPLWKQLEKFQESWGPGLESTAIELGYRVIPKLRKLETLPVRYQLVAEPIETDSAETYQVRTPEGGLRYTPAAVAAPGALLLKGLRGGVVRATRPFIVSAIALCTSILILLALSAWGMFVTGMRWNSPITTTHISIAALWGVWMWAGLRLFRFLGQLADLGIVMAPDVLVPFREDHVTLELRPRVGDARGAFAFVRYTSTCPVCSARVLLHDGGDEFKGRIVGRCASSPREHVFSFDQRLQVGYPLRERC